MYRMDSDIEEKRQNAIEQVRDSSCIFIPKYYTLRFLIDIFHLPLKFFTKGTIVPSPWATANSREHCQVKMKSRV